MLGKGDMVFVAMRRGVAAVAGVTAGALGLLTACGDRDDKAPQQGDPSPKAMVVTVATSAAPTSLDPAGPDETGARTVRANLFQSLLTILPGKPTPVPDAADCQYDSPTTYTCSLKEGLKFRNGHDLTSSDVKFSFDRMLRLGTQGPATQFTSVSAVSTPDELTAVFTLKRPDSRLPYLLTTTAASIVDEEVYPANGLLNSQAVGSGPYQLTGSKRGEQLTLARFDRYKGPRAARNDGVTMLLGRDAKALAKTISLGSADLAYDGFGPKELDKLRKSDKLDVTETDYAAIRFFSFHMKSPLVRKLAVRRAVAQLVDRPAIARAGYGDHVTPLYSLLPPGFGGHTDAFRDEYGEPNKAKAAAMLRDAGVTAPVVLTVGWTPVQYGSGARAEVLELKRQLEASGLFKVALRSADWPQYQQLARTGAYDLYHAGWIPEYPDANDYLAAFARDGGAHQNGYRSAAAMRLLEQETAEQNQLEREKVLGQLQSVLAKEVPAMPTWQGRLTVVAAKDVQNVTAALDPLGSLHFSGLRK